MPEFIAALNELTWPGAIAFTSMCAACGWAFSRWMDVLKNS